MRKRTLVSDALKRQGIEVKPSEREVNCLAGRRFEEDMEDDVRGKARRWAELMFEASFILPADRVNKGLLIISLVAAGFEAGYAEGYEVARRQKEEDENT